MVEWFVVFNNPHLTRMIFSWEFSHQVVIIIDENFPKTEEIELFIINTKIIHTVASGHKHKKYNWIE